MLRTLRQFHHIARATLVEGLQQPIALLLTLSCVVFTGIGPLVHMHVFGEEGRLARDSGLAFMLVFGLLVTGFTAGSSVSDELRRGTAATLLAKPVHRGVFLLGKWAGVAGVLACFCTVSGLATLQAERSAEKFVETAHFAGSQLDLYSGLGALLAVAAALLLAALLNFSRHSRFGLAAFTALLLLQFSVLLGCGFINRAGERLSSFDLQVNLRILPAFLLIFLLLSIHAALATALSTRFRTATTLTTCVALLFIGFLADPLLGRSPGILPALLYTLIPDVQHFWLADTLANGGRIPLRYLARAIVYAAAYGGSVLFLGVFAFRNRDIA